MSSWLSTWSISIRWLEQSPGVTVNMTEQQTDIESNINKEPSTTILTLKAILVSIFGVAVVVGLVAGTKYGVDYGFKYLRNIEVSQNIPNVSSDPRPKFLILERESGSGSDFNFHFRGVKTEFFSDKAALHNLKISPNGQRFAYCKYVNNQDGDIDGTELYVGEIGSSREPERKGFRPLNCMYDFSADSSKINYIALSADSNSHEMHEYNFRIQLDFQIFSRKVQIVSAPVEKGKFRTYYFYVAKTESTNQYILTRHGYNNNIDDLFVSNEEFDFSMSNDGSKLVIHGKKDADTLKIFSNGNFSTNLTYTFEKAFIRKTVFSANMKHIYCLICSKVDANKCKIVDLSFNKNGEPYRKETLVSDLGDAEFVLKPNV